MLEQLLLNVRQRTLAGGTVIYFAGVLHTMLPLDREEEPEQSMSEVPSEDSANSDEIFKRDQHCIFAMFENLPAEHVVRSCTKFERWLKATQIRGEMEPWIQRRDGDGHEKGPKAR